MCDKNFRDEQLILNEASRQNESINKFTKCYNEECGSNTDCKCMMTGGASNCELRLDSSIVDSGPDINLMIDVKNKQKILTIENITISGKWIEFWFKEDKKYEDVLNEYFEPNGEKRETWLKCCKGDVLQRAAKQAGIDNYSYPTDCIGMQCIWDGESLIRIIPTKYKLGENICPIEIEAIDTDCASCTGCSFIPICCSEIDPEHHDLFKFFYTKNMGVVECGNGIVFKIIVKQG